MVSRPDSTGAMVLLINPKTPYNVGSALRACARLGASTLRWTGERVEDPRAVARFSKMGKRYGRFPREERMKEYDRAVDWAALGTHLQERPLDHYVRWGVTPVCVEVDDSAEQLFDFVHPERAVYVFGPEDGDVPKGVRTACHRFVTIPATGCLNLAAAVNVVLYDRALKAARPALVPA